MVKITLEVPHIGIDYGKVVVYEDGKEVSEFEVNKFLAEYLQEFLAQ